MNRSFPTIATWNASDGYPVHYRRWQVADAMGDVVILHGIISHSGWYLKTGAHLASAGFSVHSLDRRGSGLNFRDRGDVVDCEQWIDDVVQYITALRTDQAATASKPRPLLLVGISWGGLLATAVAKRLGWDIAGLILLCPGFFSRKGTSSLQHTLVKIATGAGLGNLRFPVPLREPELFTESVQWQHYIAHDPFTLRKVTLRLATASAQLYHNTISHPTRLATTTLLMLGGRDRIIRNDQVREMVHHYYGDRPTVIEYPQAAHTLEFEDDTSSYLADLSQWCAARANGAGD